MASLRGTCLHSVTLTPVERSFSITPLAPSRDGPHDTYVVRYEAEPHGETIAFDYSVHGWQFNHSYFEYIAAIFEAAHALKHEQAASSANALYGGFDWMHVILVNTTTRKNPERRTVRLFLCDTRSALLPEERQGLHPQQHGFRLIVFHTTANECVQFGNDLMLEISEARALRADLGLQTEEDFALLKDEARTHGTLAAPSSTDMTS